MLLNLNEIIIALFFLNRCMWCPSLESLSDSIFQSLIHSKPWYIDHILIFAKLVHFLSLPYTSFKSSGPLSLWSLSTLTVA